MDTPVEAGHDDSNHDARVDGIFQQMRADLAQGHVNDAETMLRERLSDAGITLTNEQIDELLSKLL